MEPDILWTTKEDGGPTVNYPSIGELQRAMQEKPEDMSPERKKLFEENMKQVLAILAVDPRNKINPEDI